MTKFDHLRLASPGMTRRSFLWSAGAGMFVLGTCRDLAWPQSATQSVLSGTQFNLEIGEMPVNFTGRARTGTVVNGQVPAPLLRWREDGVTPANNWTGVFRRGEKVRLRFINGSSMSSKDVGALQVIRLESDGSRRAPLYRRHLRESLSFRGKGPFTQKSEVLSRIGQTFTSACCFWQFVALKLEPSNSS